MKVSDRKLSLKPILESSKGVHVSIYLDNKCGTPSLRAQLQASIADAEKELRPVMSKLELKRFLDPIENLNLDLATLKKSNGNIGIFRTKNMFRLLVLPVDVAHQCHVADSFHVKPLLRWIQSDRQFLLVGLKADSAHLYLGNLTGLQKVDSILYPDVAKELNRNGDYSSLKKARRAEEKLDEVFAWFSEWLEHLTERSKPKLFAAGPKNLVETMYKNLDYPNIAEFPEFVSFDESRLSDICSRIRGSLRGEIKKSLELAMMEVRDGSLADDPHANFFQIARAAMSGQVKRLVVADEMSIYGKLDPTTGGVHIHTGDLNHEDDDILDDLAQAVLASGGEVVVTPKEKMPEGRPLLAVLKGAVK